MQRTPDPSQAQSQESASSDHEPALPPATDLAAEGRPDRPDWRMGFVDALSGVELVYGTPPTLMRVLGWMIVCDPPEQTAQEIQRMLGLSAGSVSSAVRELAEVGMIERVRRPLDRHIYYRLRAQGWESVVSERFRAFSELRAVAEEALDAAGSAADGRLHEMRNTYAYLEAATAEVIRDSIERGRMASQKGTKPGD